MDLILCHQTADFDAVGAAVGLSRLKTGAKIVLTRGAHPTVRDFLALHRDEFTSIEIRSIDPQQIKALTIVDNQRRDRFGCAADWFDLPQIESIEVYDHHTDSDSDIKATYREIEPVGATTTLITEKLKQANIKLTSFEATVMALGIHVDTGSLSFEQTSVRDVKALAWLMEMGANLKIISEYREPSLSPQLQKLLTKALKNLEKKEVEGHLVAWVLLETESFVPGLSGITERLLELTGNEALLLGHKYHKSNSNKNKSKGTKLIVIGRSRIEGTNLNELFSPFGGGGHPQAAAMTVKEIENPETTFSQIVAGLIAQVPHPTIARDIMSSPVRTIRPDTSIEDAERILFRYGHSGLSVVDDRDRLVGVISRRDLDLALHHGFSHAPVKGYMSKNLKTITPQTPLKEIESLMVTYDVGRLPVLDRDRLVGIVTRTDVLRQLYQQSNDRNSEEREKIKITSCLLPSIRDRLAPAIWQLLTKAAFAAKQRGWHLYLVGGGVRDLLLTEPEDTLLLQDIDLVVDGFHRSADEGAGVELAREILNIYPGARLSIHGAFQTAALLWHKDPELGNLWMDIATARTEFYPYPAANPEVEASSIRQDLYRRDFTINALAARLTDPKAGELLDYFGGILDLRSRLIRVLHSNSFIEDPTRIYRAVRFAVRLEFTIEAQTEAYIRYAIESGVYHRKASLENIAPALTTRLKAELKYILQAGYWKNALKLLADLDALSCLHPSLKLDKELWWQIRCVDRWLQHLDSKNNLNDWLVRLETIIAYLPPQKANLVAERLQLPKDSISRVTNLEENATKIAEKLPDCQLVSQKVQLLRHYDTLTLILVAARNNKQNRRSLWQYLNQWSKMRSPLDGRDLKALGYKPGPLYKEILEELLAATLDGKISDRAEAEDLLSKKYPH